ncbi:hypothetical protein EON66_03085 [archaeon]|nr:MAG: hypothetical protein EON66_03085 [archaeon]
MLEEFRLKSQAEGMYNDAAEAAKQMEVTRKQVCWALAQFFYFWCVRHMRGAIRPPRCAPYRKRHAACERCVCVTSVNVMT